MSGVFLLAPGPMLIDPNRQTVHSNSTITGSGAAVYSGFGTKEITLVVNVKNAPTGTSPTLQYTLQEVDPGDGETVFGPTVQTTIITGTGIQRVTIRCTFGGHLKVSWAVTGTTPSFTGVYATLATRNTSAAAGVATDGTEVPLRADTNGSMILSPQTIIAVTTSPSGATAGISRGAVTTSATTDVPIRATTYTEPTTNAQRSMASSSTSDTAAGTGARTVRITYFDQTGAGPYTETITLNGTTAVNTVATNICFICCMEVMTVGSGGSNAGTITLFASTGGGGGTVGTIAIGANQTQWAHHYVPTGKTCYVCSISGHNNNSSNGVILTIRRKTIGASSPEVVVSDQVRVGGASGQVSRQYGTPFPVAGPARLVLYGAPEGTPSITHRASFDYYDQ